jgi:D-glycero-alpha-D-manno-heptose-7-phosphate kinase
VYAHSQAPVRIGIAGGGTDLPIWTQTRVGRCLSLAIASYTHAVAMSRPDGQVVASYRKRDVARAATEIANGLIRESALMHGWEEGFEVHTLSELSSRGSGLGVSSSIAVSLAACFQRLSQLRRNDSVAGNDGPVWQEQLARDAWTVEIDRLHRPIGRQDHMAAVHGGLRLYGFAGNEAEVVQSFSKEDAEWVAQHLVLVQLPEGHDSRAILSLVKSVETLEHASEAVPIALQAIERRDAKALGHALRYGHASKEKINGAVPQWINEITSKLIEYSYGCKVTGAGGGGHLVVACEPNAVEAIAQATMLPVLPVKPDFRGVRSDGWL